MPFVLGALGGSICGLQAYAERSLPQHEHPPAADFLIEFQSTTLDGNWLVS